MFRTLEDQKRAQEAARVEQAKKVCIAEVFADPAYEAILPCEGNSRRVIDVILQWTNYDESVLPTKNVFDLAMTENPDEIKTFALRPTAKQKQDLIEELIGLLEKGGKGHDQFTLNSERKRLNMMSLLDIRTRLANLKESRKMAAIPVAQHKADLVAARPTFALPEVPAEIDAAAIKAMSSSDLKLLIRKHGSPAVNLRLAGK
jgi:hypothetical protein